MLLSRAEVALSKGQLESTDKQEVCPARSLFLEYLAPQEISTPEVGIPEGSTLEGGPASSIEGVQRL